MSVARLYHHDDSNDDVDDGFPETYVSLLTKPTEKRYACDILRIESCAWSVVPHRNTKLYSISNKNLVCFSHLK